MVVGRVVEEPAPPDAAGAPCQRITGRDEIRALLTDVGRGHVVRLALDGVEATFRAALWARAAVPGRRAPTVVAIEARIAGAALPDRAWTGGTAVAWFVHGGVVMAFRSRVMGGGPTQLLLDLPDAVLRYTRRVQPRYPLPAGTAVAAAVPLDDSSWIREAPVADLSTGGLAVVLPLDVEFGAGDISRIGLRLPDTGWLGLMVRCRHSRPGGTTHRVHGLELLDPPRATLHAIQAGIARLGQPEWLESAASPQYLPGPR
jgi:hypothetical protein